MRVFFDFEGVLEAKLAPKIDFWTAFWDVFLAPSFWSVFFLIFDVFFDARILKNHAPVEAGARFLHNRVVRV